MTVSKHVGCPSYPNCDEAPLGCTVKMGVENVEWYGHKDEPKTKINKKFDKDLKYGERFQNQVHNVLINSKLEMKCERDKWRNTGNVFLEYECNGKPSGICKKSTESDFWIHGLDLGGNHMHCAILFKVSRLQKIVDKYKDTCTKRGGDGYRSLGVVIPISKLFEKETIDIEKDESDFWGEWKEDVETD